MGLQDILESITNGMRRRFPIEEVKEAMRVGVGRLDQSDTKHPEYKEGNLRLPPQTAIANRLIEAVLTDFAGNLTSSL